MRNFDAAARLASVHACIGRFIAEGEIAGAALAVAVDGVPISDWYGGEAAPGVAAGPETLWPLASISKLYTASTVMALVERGDLTLSTKVRAILPRFDGEGRERVTLRHLLMHTSGVIYESPEMEALLLRQASLDEIVDEVYSRPLTFAPGTRQSYSDLGFALAGRVAATVAGRPFPELVRDLVLEPAGLSETTFAPAEAGYPRLARVRGAVAEGTPGAMYNAPYALGLAHPAFGAVASVRDLLSFGLLFDPKGPRRILSDASRRLMTTDQSAVYGGAAAGIRPIGIGFWIGNRSLEEGDLLSPSSYGHSGATGCALAIDPLAGVTIAYVSNRHIRSDPERFDIRTITVMNGVLAALTSAA